MLTLHTCSRGHKNEYATADYMDGLDYIFLKATKIIAVTFSDSFRLQ